MLAGLDCAGVCVAGAAFDCGAADCGLAGVTGTGLAAGFENFCRIEPPCSTALSVRRTSAMAQTMNIIAHQVVA